MAIEITSRHVELPGMIQDYARDKSQSLLDEFPRLEHVHMILDAQRHSNIAELVVQGKNRIRVEADDKADDIRTAIDAATHKVEKQLRKLRDKVTDHKVKAKHGARNHEDREREPDELI